MMMTRTRRYEMPDLTPHSMPDGAVMVCEINEVNDWPVGKPQEQGVMNIAASFSLSKKPRLSIE
jgi:hypothetical protein